MSADALDAFIERMRALGTLPADAAKLAAPLVEAAVKKTAAAGTTPDGKPWALTKKGEPALKNAAKALSAKAVGPAVVVTLKGVEVLHDRGTESLPSRKILPDGGAGLPANVAEALTAGARDAFNRTMGAA